MYQVTEEEPIGADKSGLKQMGGPTSAPGRYVNPFARGDIRISNGILLAECSEKSNLF